MSDTPRTDAMQGHRMIAHVPVHFAQELERELAQRTAERDEARREICINEANELAYDLERKGVFGITGASMAEKRGWDCFKEVQR